MNLLEARKLAHEGWVRSPTRTNLAWHRTVGSVWQIDGTGFRPDIRAEDLDAEDWEPKPLPPKPFEAEVWVSLSGNLVIVGADSEDRLARAGWRKIRVREVTE